MFLGDTMTRDDQTDVDWGGLVAAGSLLGNLLQYTQNSNLEEKLHWTGERLRAIAQDRERVIQMFEQIRDAYDSLRSDAERIQSHNIDLLQKLEMSESNRMKLASEVEELRKIVSILEAQRREDDKS